MLWQSAFFGGAIVSFNSPVVVPMVDRASLEIIFFPLLMDKADEQATISHAFPSVYDWASCSMPVRSGLKTDGS